MDGKNQHGDDDRIYERDDGWWGVHGLPDENYYDKETAARIARQLDHDTAAVNE